MTKTSSRRNEIPDVALSDLFAENTTKMQSTMVYQALRGEGMRVMPLVGSRGSFKASSEDSLDSKRIDITDTPTSARTLRTRTWMAKAADPFETASDTSYQQEMDNSSTQRKPESQEIIHGSRAVEIDLKQTKDTSLGNSKRVPFRSTQLEKPTSRASLQDDLNKEQKVNKTGKRITVKKAIKVIPKTNMVLTKARISSNIPHQISPKRRRVTNKYWLDERDEGTSHSNKIQPPNNAESTLRKTATKDDKNNEKVEKYEEIDSASTPPSRCPARGKFEGSISKGAQNKTPMSNSAKKMVRIPTSENIQSWNKFSWEKTRRTPARKPLFPRRGKKSIREYNKIDETALVNKDGSTESDSDSSGVHSVTNEDTLQPSLLEMRSQMVQKSIEFFNQFKTGKVLKEIMPRVRYNSEIQVDTTTKKRLPVVEVQMRLCRLEESESKIIEHVPKWTGLLSSMKQDVADGIQKTLTNANHILKKVVDAKEMLTKYMNMCDPDSHSPPTEEMLHIENLSHLVQLDMDSLERLFGHHEEQLKKDLDEPSS